jgi:hypothetical protein
VEGIADMKYKVLSIKQPWAWLIVNGHKDVENRSWKTNYRGSLLIHAGKTSDRFADYNDIQTGTGIIIPSKLPVGCVIGSVSLIDCHPGDRPINVWHNKGYWGWLMRDAIAYDLHRCIPLKGQLGLFEFDAASEDEH